MIFEMQASFGRVPQLPLLDLGNHEPQSVFVNRDKAVHASEERAIGPTAGGCRQLPSLGAQSKNEQ